MSRPTSRQPLPWIYWKRCKKKHKFLVFHAVNSYMLSTSASRLNARRWWCFFRCCCCRCTRRTTFEFVIILVQYCESLSLSPIDAMPVMNFKLKGASKLLTHVCMQISISLCCISIVCIDWPRRELHLWHIPTREKKSQEKWVDVHCKADYKLIQIAR